MSLPAPEVKKVDALEEFTSLGIQIWQFEIARAKSVKFLRVQNGNQVFDKGIYIWWLLILLL